MSLQALLTTLALPPVMLVLAALAGGLLALRGWRHGGTVAALAAALLLLLSTPIGAGLLRASLEREAVPRPDPGDSAPPGAIVVLGAEIARGAAHPEVGPLTLERLRAAAALHRRTGLPLLVTGGPLAAGGRSLAALMAESLAEDFGVAVRWVEPRARDTRENAALSAAMLREAGIHSAYVVTHAWHLPRARDSFARQEGFSVLPAPVRIGRVPDGRHLWGWVPRADHLGASWYAIREWAGRLVYALRGG